jgi:alanyl-tRNA synthetase
MTMEPIYSRDPFLTELETDVVAVGVDDDRPWVELADTIFYPEGGGQPADGGRIGSAEVLDVRKIDGGIRHTVSQPLPLGPVHLKLDWPRRWDHMQQHTAQHVLTAVALRDFSWRTTAFHLGADVSDIELDVPSLDREDLDRLETAVADEIRAARAVSYRTADTADFERLGVRSRRLPAGFSGPVRLVEIDGLDLNTCGGTHLRSTAEIGCLCLLGTEPMRGGTRMFFIAGDRVRRRMSVHEQRNARLRSLLDTGDDELPEVVALRLEREKELARATRSLGEALADATAAEIAAQEVRVIERHWEGRDMPFLQRVARSLVAAAPEMRALLTATEDDEHLFVVAGGAESGLETADVGPHVADLFEGRGGGRGEIYQGKAGTLARRDEALEVIRTS